MTLAAIIVFAMASQINAQGPGAGAGGQRGGGGAGGAGGGRGGGQNAALASVMVKPGLFMVTGGGANSMVRVSNDGLVVVDLKQRSEMVYNDFMAQIKMISDKPIKYAVVGDVHQDKSGNTEYFTKAGVQVIAHVNEKKGLETYTNAAGTPGPPTITYDKDYAIKLGTAEVAHVYHFGAAATGGDSFTYFPDLKVVTMGDVYQQGINCDYAQGGSMIEWPKTLEALMKLDFDTVIPNRGNPVTRAELQASHDRIAKIDAAAIDLVKKGTPKEQLIEKINAIDPTFQVNAFLNINPQARLDAFYDEVSKAAK